MRESAIQKKVQEYLQGQGWLVVKIIQTNCNGWPDLQAHRAGVTIFIECKAPGKQPAPLQAYRHQQLIKQGFSVYVIDNLSDVKRISS